MKMVAITQRVTVDPHRGERRDWLDQNWTGFFMPAGWFLFRCQTEQLQRNRSAGRHHWRASY